MVPAVFVAPLVVAVDIYLVLRVSRPSYRGVLQTRQSGTVTSVVGRTFFLGRDFLVSVGLGVRLERERKTKLMFSRGSISRVEFGRYPNSTELDDYSQTVSSDLSQFP